MIALLFGLADAQAVNMTQNLCWRFSVDFGDDDTVAYMDDYLNDDGAQWFAKSTKILVKKNPSGAETTHWTDTNGCIAFTAEIGASYTAKLAAISNQSSRILEVRPDAGQTEFRIPKTFTADLHQPTRTYLTDASVSGSEWIHAFLAGSRVIRQNTAGFVTATYRIFLKDSGSTHGALYSPTQDAVIIDPDPFPSQNGYEYSERKYVVAHELGHQLQQRLNETQIVSCPGFPLTTCNSSFYATKADSTDPEISCESDYFGATNGYSKASREFQSLAAAEGFADYVAALSFNDPAGSDCSIVPVGEVYWNGAGIDAWPANSPYSCEGAVDGDGSGAEANPNPGQGATALTGADSYAQQCLASPNNDRATIVDWTRFFWDLDTKHAVFDLQESGELWASMWPHTWCKDASCANSYRPAVRLSTVMTSGSPPTGWSAAHSAQAARNGVTR